MILKKEIWKTCPNCKNKLNKAGKIRIKGIKNIFRLAEVYYCKVCGWRGT